MRISLDFIARGSFQTANSGVRLFYPNGFAGKGYVIDSEEMYQRLFRQQKHWGVLIMVMISLLVATHAGWTLVLPLFILLNLLKQVAIRQTTRHMQPTDIPYSVGGFFREGLRLPMMSRDMQFFLAASGLLVAIGSLAAIAWQPELWRKLLGWSATAALVAYLALRELRGDNDHRRQTHEDVKVRAK